MMSPRRAPGVGVAMGGSLLRWIAVLAFGAWLCGPAAAESITMLDQSIPPRCSDWHEQGPHSWVQTGTIRFGNAGSTSGNMFTDTPLTQVLDEKCRSKAA